MKWRKKVNPKGATRTIQWPQTCLVSPLEDSAGWTDFTNQALIKWTEVDRIFRGLAPCSPCQRFSHYIHWIGAHHWPLSPETQTMTGYTQVTEGGGLVSIRREILMESEPELPEVPDDDKMLIRNIVYSVMALNSHDPFCKRWQVQCISKGYIVVFFLTPKYAISLHDIVSVRDINPLRITNVVICEDSDNTEGSKQSRPLLKFQVLNHQQPVIQYETEVVKVRKRARTWFWQSTVWTRVATACNYADVYMRIEKPLSHLNLTSFLLGLSPNTDNDRNILGCSGHIVYCLCGRGISLQSWQTKNENMATATYDKKEKKLKCSWTRLS